MRLNVKAFGLTCALVWGAAIFVLTWWIMAFEGATKEATFIGRVYRGYSITPLGSLIGLVEAFVDGLIGGLIFAWLYNWLTEKLKKIESTGQE
ncbi:MAG: bacteriophage holin [Planctomycetota bacterium]|nr:MAG: bacteriophage holin [Planctomycetota bacterium]